MGKSGLIAVFIFTSILAGSEAAYADTHWVNLGGSNQPPYTSFATGAHEIQDAIDQSLAGDTVRIAAGVHRPDTTIFLRDSIAVIGTGRDSTVIMPSKESDSYQHPAILKLEGQSGGAGGGFTLKGCTIRDYLRGPGDSPDRYGILLGLKNTTPNYIIDNDFRFCWFGIDAGYANLAIADNFFDSNNVAISINFGGPFDVHHNTIIGRPFYEGGPCGSGIDAGSWPLVGPAKIHHNTILTCRAGVISVKGVDDSILVFNNLAVTSGPYAVWMFCYCDALIVRNNTFIWTAPPSTANIASFTPELPNRMVVENNVFAAKGGVIKVWYDNSGGTIRLAYNDLWRFDSGSGDLPGVDYDTRLGMDTVGNTYRDPMFAGDSTYRLQRGSPLIDAGNPALLDLDLSRSDIGWTGGPEGIVYSYPEEPPKCPDTLIGQASDETVLLSWPRNTEADLAEYRLYRDAFSGFVPHPGNLLVHVSSSDTSHQDPVNGIPGDLFYVLTAADTAGLESSPSHEVAHLATGILGDVEDAGAHLSSFFSMTAYPNPANSTVVVELATSVESPLRRPPEVAVFDVLGRKLVDLSLGDLGSRRWVTVWSGSDSAGRRVTSGLYFVRATYQGQHIVRKVCLIK